MNARPNIRLVVTTLLIIGVQFSVALAQPKDTIFYQDVSWSPDGSKLLLSRLDISGDNYLHRIFLVNADGSNYKKVTDGPNDVWTSWSPDGKGFVFASKKANNNDICKINIDGSNLARLTTNSANDTHPDWSPDGKQIAYITIDTTTEVRVIDLDDSTPNFTDYIEDIRSKRIGTVERKGTTPEVCIMKIDGSRVAITDDLIHKDNPRWSPNGKSICYYGSREGGKDSVYIIDDKGENRVTQCEGVWPSWSPDGSKILFTLEKNIYQISIDGTNQTKLIDNAYFARWSPDGKKIAFIRTTWRAEKGWPSTSAVYVANSDGTSQLRIAPKSTDLGPFEY